MKIRKLVIIPMVLVLVLMTGISAMATDNLPYDTYNYDYWGYVYNTPAAYVYSDAVTGLTIKREDGTALGAFKTPQDMCVSEDGKVYIADTGNNRIIVTDLKFNLLEEITEYVEGEEKKTFNQPYGVFVSQANILYIADKGNGRVVGLTPERTVHKIIQNPKSEEIEEKFAPVKVAVDYADRAFVISAGSFQGIMAFDEKGDFTGFTGNIPVSLSVMEKFWRIFSTKAQRSRGELYISTEFTGLDIDKDGFVYATYYDANGTQAIRRLNPKGEDVIKKSKRLSVPDRLAGDLFYRAAGNGNFSGPSRMIDIVYRGRGVYSVMDFNRGRIFTYDHEGNILYIFGGMGTQDGTFASPVALDVIGENIVTLDSKTNSIQVFDETRYGNLINQAVYLRYDGDEKKAVEMWKEVLALDSNFELAYVGIGKSLLAAGENEKAMKYFKIGMDREYYSIAYKRYRNDMLKDNLGYVLTVLVTIIVGYVSFKKYRKIKAGREED